MSTIAITAAIVALIVAVAILGFLLISARGEVDDNAAAAADDRRAEQVATDYAIGASNIDFQNVDDWLAKLKANTSPELANKFDATAPKLQEILVPLKWTSSATPIAAKVASETGGIYVVNVFVNVTSTSAQTPDGGQTTVTYNVTVDKNSDWKITDVGGMEGALPVR
ncbi:hypothetical protein [Antrihabitans spumae]|jgi:Mce-associated membrane protein|uniref:Mce-associated membrane protein n=1 Tax=Antrihabitans spumae TaxID=3373370 RepID=A0ABW7K2S2_9NOCA